MGPQGNPHQPSKPVSKDHLIPSFLRHEEQKMPLDPGRRRVMTTALRTYMNVEARSVESTLPHFRHLTVTSGVWSCARWNPATASLCATNRLSAKPLAA